MRLAGFSRMPHPFAFFGKGWDPTFLLAAVLFSTSLLAQTTSAPPAAQPENYSGMYTFLEEGEFVQVSVEDAGKVTGFVSRYGDSDASGNRGAFIDQFFKQGKLDGNKLTFTTEASHGVWFEFTGTVDHGEGKTPADEAYHVLKGTLTDFKTGADKKVSSKSHDVILKSFPQDAQ
jgi:hypothetical protein